MPKTKAVSPARSQGANTTPKRKSTRGSRSLCSPALSTASGRLTSIIDQFKDKNMESFALSPLNRRSVLNDNTEIEEPRRKSWWKKLDENSQDVMEVLEDNKLIVNNAIDEFIDIDVLSQEKKNVTLDIPDSSDNESINSIVLPQRRLFTQKENQPQKKFGQLIDNRESLAKLHKTNNTNIDKTVNVGTRELFRNAKRSKPIFPAALLNISPNKTTADKTKENVLADPKPQVRNIFGNRLGTKRKNMFADFIVSESEDEISDIQPRVFGFQNKIEQRRISSVSRGRDPSPTSSITTDIEMDFRNMLPSSTMVENQLDEMMVSTPVKRARLSKLSEAKESEAGTLQTNSTGEKSRQSNKSISSKNKSKASPEIRNKSLNSSRTTKSMLKNASKRENVEEKGKRNKSNVNDNENDDLEANENEENADESQELEAEENKSQQTKNESLEVNAEVNESQEIAAEANESQEVEGDEDENNEEMLPSTTMVENQVEGMIVSTPVKRSKLSKLSEAIESETGSNTLQANTTGDKTRQSNKYFPSKNKSKASPEIKDKSMNSSRTTRSMLKNASKREDTSVQNKDEEMVEQEIEEDTNNSRYGKNIEKEHEPNDEININQENRQETNESEENDDEVNVSQKDDDKQNESQEVDNEDNESEEYRLRYNDSDDNNEETNESQHVEADVHVSQGANESQEVVEDVDESHDTEEVEEEANDSQEIEAEANESEKEANESQEVGDEVNESQEIEDEVNESQEVEAEANESEEVEEEANESQEVEEEADESQEVEAEANESQDVQEEANESQEVEDDQDENAEVMSEDEEEAVNEASANESQEVENDEEESQNEVASEAEDEDVEDDQQMDESDEADKAIASDPEISDDNQADEMEVDDDEEQESENESEQNEHESHEEQNEIEASEEIDESPNVTHDTTGRHRKKHLSTSPEVMLKDKTKQMDSFTVKARNTSIRKTASLAPHRNSTGFSDGTKNSSAEGSGWDSHRTTRKTLRQTFGKDFTPRKSLRALVMEKSAKRQTEHMEMHSETVKFPLANSTEMPEDSARHDDDIIESDHELSRRTRLSALEMALQKIKEQNIEKRLKLEAAVRNSLKNPPTSSLSLFKVPNKPAPRRLKPAQNKHKKQLKSVIPLDELPAEVIQDMKYKPPKRFRPSNAAWITKRLYKFFEDKLEAKYDYKARVRSEKLAETLYNFTKDLRRHNIAPTDAVEVLKHEFARLNIVRTHFEFYEFFHEFMPTEIRVKVVPDIINKIPLPRHGVFSDILRE